MAKHEEYRWKDPFYLSSPGPVLLSDQISVLAEEIGLIEPFDPTYLRPASYDLRVGNSYYVDDVRTELTGESKQIEIPSNGLVYIRTKEKFNVPYYLVARYSLRVHQVYRGLLIDNGLHIDPGYCGHIWIPVHNFTTQPRILLQGDEFISVEFNRTTRLPGDVYTIGSEDELVARGIENKLKGENGRTIKVFYKDLDHYRKRHDELTPHYFWDKFRGEKHESAMLGTEQRLDKVKRDVEVTVDRRVDQLRRDSIIALAALVITILGVLLPIVYLEFGKNRDGLMQNAAEIRDLRERLQEQKNQLDAITAGQTRSSPGSANTPTPQKSPGATKTK
jgi:deoxycytidine triphosphate deaminase